MSTTATSLDAEFSLSRIQQDVTTAVEAIDLARWRLKPAESGESLSTAVFLIPSQKVDPLNTDTSFGGTEKPSPALPALGEEPHFRICYTLGNPDPIIEVVLGDAVFKRHEAGIRKQAENLGYRYSDSDIDPASRKIGGEFARHLFNSLNERLGAHLAKVVCTEY